MQAKLQGANKVVGTRRLAKAIEAGQVREAYIAQDADIFITRQITDLCRNTRIPLVEFPSMKALGEACGVDVPTASAGILR